MQERDSKTSKAAEKALRNLMQNNQAEIVHTISTKQMAIDLLMGAGISTRIVWTTLILAATIMSIWTIIYLVPKKPPLAVHPVVGTVMFGKIIPHGAQVFLHLKNGVLPESAVPRGKVGEDGSVTFSTYPQAPGVPVGNYVVIMYWHRIGTEGNALPAKYYSPATSPLSISIKSGFNNMPPLIIEPKE